MKHLAFQHDDLYDCAQDIVDFSFDARTVAVFPDMIKRSIPAYSSLLHMIGVLAAEALPEGGRVYDLGCALGAASLSIHQQAPHADIHALDLSPPMIKRLQEHLEAYQIPRIQAEVADVLDYDFAAADVFVASFTFQFLAPEQRLTLLRKMKEALRPEGLIIIAEKTQASAQMVHWHERFKRAQGYSALAIAQKRAALEHVMRIDTVASIEQRFRDCGLAYEAIFQALSFRAWAAWHDA